MNNVLVSFRSTLWVVLSAVVVLVITHIPDIIHSKVMVIYAIKFKLFLCFIFTLKKSFFSESPKTDNNIMTPNVPGLNMPFQFPNGPAHTSKQYIDNLSTNMPTNQKIQSSTTTVSFAPKGTQANVITYSTSLYKAIMKTNAEKTNFRSFVITPSFSLGDSYKTGYNKAIKDSSFPHEYTAVIVGLGTVLSIFLILVLIFVVKWRSTQRELRRQQSELYFVEKANRQSSLVSDITLELEREKRMSVYSEVSDDIEPPSPQADVILTPTVPPLTPGQKQQTAFCYPADDNRHDYLELI